MRPQPAHFALALATATALACARREAPVALPPPLVHVFTVAAAPDEPLELRASLTAARRARLGFRQAGVIDAVTVEEGQPVRRGQLVARLNDTDARAAVRAAQAAREKARRDAARAERLAGEGAAPTSLRDDARSQLEAAEADLARAEEALARTRLLSPVDGTVFVRLAEPGETVGSGAPVVLVDSSGQLVARAGATERELQLLTAGVAASLLLEDGTSLPGRLTSLAAMPSAEDGLYALEITPAAGAAAKLVPGALVRLRFASARGARVLRIPIEALVHRNDQDHVFVLEDAPPSPRARLRPVTIDTGTGRTLVVRQGLSGGERIVAEGAYFLQDGQAVRVAE